MNAAERIQAVWKRYKPDRTPWSPMLGDSYLRSQPAYWGQLRPEERSALQNSYRYPSLVPLPGDFSFLERITWQMAADVGGDTTAETATVVPVDDDVVVEVLPGALREMKYLFHTPWGELSEIVTGSGSAETVYRVRFAISKREEYDVLAQVAAARRYQPCYQRFVEKEILLGERGACAVVAPDQPLVALFRVRDPAELIYDLNDEPERMGELMEGLHRAALEGYRLIARGPGRMVQTGMAFITTRLISPRIFEAYVLPYLSIYARELHAAGKILVCHMCGHVRHLLPLLRQAGVDGIDSLTSPPTGDTDLETFWQIMGDEAILQGGIDVQVLLNGSPEQVFRHTQDVLVRSQGRPLILRSADEVPYGTPRENLLAVARAVQSSSP